MIANRFFQTKTFFQIVPMILAFLLLAGSPALSQTGQFSLALTVGLPRADFERSLDGEGFGINGNLAIRLGLSPFLAGIEAAYLIYGRETRNVPFSLTIPDVTVDVETSNNIFQSHLYLRAQNDLGAVRPYMDGLLGFNYLFTKTSIKDEDDIDDEDIASSTNLEDFAFSYGLGGGLLIRLHEPDRNAAPGARRTAIFLDLRARYLLGSEAEYLKKGGIDREDGEIRINPVRSKTDLLTINVGVSFTF